MIKVFYTTTTQHLRIRLPFSEGKATISRFADGEIKVSIEESVKNKTVWIVAATPAPADNYMELFFLLDALSRAGAQIKLLITYLGYARQDKAKKGEAVGAEVISNFIGLFPIKKIVVLHAHSDQLHQYLKFQNVIPYQLFSPLAAQADVIVAPDFGAEEFARHLAHEEKRELAVIKKQRISDTTVKMVSITGTVKNKTVLLVDDMISTAHTIIEASKLLKKKGAKTITVAATHALFSGDAINKLESSSINKIYITNSLPLPFYGSKTTIMDIRHVCEKIIRKSK